LSSAAQKASGAKTLSKLPVLLISKNIKVSSSSLNRNLIDFGKAIMGTHTKSKPYKTETPKSGYRAPRYTPGDGRLVLRTEQDWDKAIALVEISEDGRKKHLGVRHNPPLQFLNGAVARASRVDAPVLGDDEGIPQGKGGKKINVLICKHSICGMDW
jgi:hypothetical protein